MISYFSKLYQKASAFPEANRGNVAITFGIAGLVATTLVGIGIDYSRASNAREKLQWAVDGAALTAKRTHIDNRRTKGDAAARTYAIQQGNNIFNSNIASVASWFKSGTPKASFAWSATDDAAQVTATAKATLIFGGLVGKSEIDVKAYAEVGLGQSLPVEISLVLDNTASMFFKDGRAQSRFTLLRNASKKFVNALFDAATTPDLVRVAVVPWTTTVNAKSEYPLAWDTSGKQEAVQPDRGTQALTINGLVPRTSAVINYQSKDYYPSDWRGCISGKNETSGYTDAAKSGPFFGLNVTKRELYYPNPNIGEITLEEREVTDWSKCEEYNTVQYCTCDVTNTCSPTTPTTPSNRGLNPFQSEAPKIPISLRNIAPSATRTLPGLQIGCWYDCKKYKTEKKEVPVCKPLSRIKNPSCDQDTEGGRINRYNDSDKAPDDKCVTGWQDQWTCRASVDYTYQALGSCISDPNEIAYNKSGGKWCPWISTTTKNWDSFDPVNGTPIVGPSINCPMPMLGLSGNRPQILATIDRMSPAPGGTHADVGLRWGMRSLSPDAYWTSFFGLGTRPAEAWSSEKGKIMMLITDGENTTAKDIPGYWGCEGTVSGSTCDGTKTVTELNTEMIKWCEAIRNKGVRLITVALNITNPDAVKLLSQCAGSAKDAYSIDAAQLEQLLKDIAEGSILKLYLRR